MDVLNLNIQWYIMWYIIVNEKRFWAMMVCQPISLSTLYDVFFDIAIKFVYVTISIMEIWFNFYENFAFILL